MKFIYVPRTISTEFFFFFMNARALIFSRETEDDNE